MVRRFALASVLIALIAGMVGVGAGAASASKPETQKTNHGHEFKAKDAKDLSFGFGRNPNLTNHGGPIMTASVVKAVYWGTQWGNSSFIGDKQSGLDSFYSGWSGSNYGKTTTEYSSSNGQVSGNVSYGASLVDTSAGRVTTTNNQPPPVGDGTQLNGSLQSYRLGGNGHLTPISNAAIFRTCSNRFRAINRVCSKWNPSLSLASQYPYCSRFSHPSRKRRSSPSPGPPPKSPTERQSSSPSKPRERLPSHFP